MATMFQSEAFSHFIEILQEKENSDLSELVEPLMKSDKLSNNEYSFLLRGRLEVYQAIRDEIKRIINLANSYAISD